ncbi:tetratricopeptide repeat protein [Lentibacillus cibarius]|uniref:Tetratricopeptide repeat protein n=1 Tax=Lentibacillus cibarius TaxID=2583219 RepID=A0A5S3QIY9_9BACI|nr:hypothetical protein [Lentibacillus cibarius]TMN21884.1 hypothetical protein FFL34_06970 [Lentibacillus cibarius]
MSVRYQIEREDGPICIVSFIQDEDGNKVRVKPLKKRKRESEQIKDLLEQIEFKDGNSPLEFIESCLEKFDENAFSYREVDSGDYQVTLQFGVGKKQIGTSSPLINGVSEYFGENVMSDALERMKTNAYYNLEENANELLAMVRKERYQEAFELYQDDTVKTNLYLAGTAPEILLDAIFQIKAEELPHESRVKLSLQKLGACEINQCHARAESDARWLLEQDSSLSEDVIFNVRLALGNALVSQELFEAAEFHYNEALKMEKEINAHSKAWAYYNIGYVLKSQGKMTEALESYTKAGDLWLNKGDHQQAIRAYMSVIRHYEGSQPKEAIHILQERIDHLVVLQNSNSETIGISHVLGYLYFHQGKIADELKRYEKAKDAFLSSYHTRKGLIGIDDEIEATLNYLVIVCRALGESEEAQSWKTKLHDFKERSIKTEDWKLRERMITLLNTDSEIDPHKLAELKQDVDKMESIHLRVMFLLTLASRQIDEKPDIALQSLDQAMKLNIEEYPDEHVLVLKLYAKIMKVLNRMEKAYDYLCEAIRVKPTYIELYPQVVFLAQELGKDDSKLEHALSWVKIEEDNVTAWQVIGTQYEKLGQPRESYEAFKEALAVAPFDPEVQEQIKQSLHRVTEQVMEQTETDTRSYPLIADFLNEPKEKVHKTIQNRMSEKLYSFQKIIEKHHTPDFWRRESGKIKWISSPEKKAQQYLLLYLRTQLHPDIEVLDEVVIGEGRMDVYIRIPPGINLILEIKMCGEGYSSTYTKGAIEQTEAYMDKKDCTMGYLVVFDARKRDLGKGFEQLYQLGNKQIETQIIDIRHKSPSGN